MMMSTQRSRGPHSCRVFSALSEPYLCLESAHWRARRAEPVRDRTEQQSMKTIKTMKFGLVLIALILTLCSADLNESTESTQTQEDILYADHQDFREEEYRNEAQRNQSSGSSSDLEYERELKFKQAEALRERKMRERQQEGLSAVKRTINAASSEDCDWKSQPVAFLKGEVCGSHYKVLGIDRKNRLNDKSLLKKKYRQLSLHLHPDKNPAENAEDAFNVLQDAYNCIQDDLCKEEYDSRLAAAEGEISLHRSQLKEELADRSIVLLNQAHYYVSLGANHVYNIGLRFWEMLGEWQVTIFEESYPLGRPVALLALLWKGQFLLKIHALSYLVIRINFEIAKARGWV